MPHGVAPGSGDSGTSPYVTARAVTTRTATINEDEQGQRTQQLTEETVASSLTTSARRQEQRTVTQQVTTTSTVLSGEQVLYSFNHPINYSMLAWIVSFPPFNSNY